MKRTAYILVTLMIVSFQLSAQIIDTIDYQVKDFYIEEQPDESKELLDRIIDYNKTDDSISIRIGCETVFCDNYKLRLLKSSDSLFISFYDWWCPSSYYTYGEIEFTIPSILIDSSKIKLNKKLIGFSDDKYKMYPISFDIENGDTLNYVDEFGRRQGRYIFYFKNGKLWKDVDYKDNEQWEGLFFVKYDSLSNVIEKQFIHEGKINHRVEYYITGQKKLECYETTRPIGENSYQFIEVCKQWDSEGNRLDDIILSDGSTVTSVTPDDTPILQEVFEIDSIINSNVRKDNKNTLPNNGSRCTTP